MKRKNSDTITLVNDSVRALKAYHLTPETCSVKLNQNENPNDWSCEIKKRAADFFAKRPWNRYPNFIPTELKAALAKHVSQNSGANITADNIIVGNGSNEMLLVLLLAFAQKAEKIILCSPTFTVYKLLADGMNVQTINVPLTPDLQYDAAALKRAAAENPGAILILCSPNNPVGNSISERGLKEIMDAHTGICILDQAYSEFGGLDAVPLLAEYDNLIVARTFSKAMAGAGLRLGYMIGASELISEINKIKLPYNINFFSEHAAHVILENVSFVKNCVDTIIKERDGLFEFFETLPLENVYKSDANFILIRSNRKQELFEYLKKNDILVRDVSGYPMLENCLRITVGLKEENVLLKSVFKKFYGDG